MAPTVDYINRLVQVGAKYTLDQTFEPCWGNIVLDVSPRGLSTPTLRLAGVTFRVHYHLLDAEALLETSNGTATVPLRTRSVADVYAEFVDAAAALGIPAPGSAIATEIPGALNLDVDREVREWPPEAAGLVWSGFDAGSRIDPGERPARHGSLMLGSRCFPGPTSSLPRTPYRRSSTSPTRPTVPPSTCPDGRLTWSAPARTAGRPAAPRRHEEQRPRPDIRPSSPTSRSLTTSF